MRWILPFSKDKITISKDNKSLMIETLDSSIYEALCQELKSKSLDKEYFKSIIPTEKNNSSGAYQLALQLSKDNVEMFQFRREEDQSLIIDFWVNNEDSASAKDTEELTKSEKIKKKKELSIEIKEDWIEPDKVVVEKKKEERKKDELLFAKEKLDKITENVKLLSESPQRNEKKTTYLDFRYGSSFLWKYEPIMPMIEKDIDLTVKTPEFLYPVVDRPKFKEEREAHLQLMINFYKKRNFGFMKKSIDLFEKRYKLRPNERELIKYLSALSLIQSHFKSSNPSLFASAIVLLEELLQETTDSTMKQTLYRYIIQYKIDQKDYVGSLKFARDFFIFSQEKNIKSQIFISSKTIMFALAKLGEVDKLDKFMEEPSVQDWLDGQEGLGFKFYSMYLRGDFGAITNQFEKREKGLTKPFYPPILFTVAEAYFNLGEFEKSLALYKDFVKSYSFISEASFARLRIALNMDLLDYPFTQVTSSYLEAINLSTLAKARYEAKLRYIGLAFNRKVTLAPNDSDKTILGFFDYQMDEEIQVKDNLKQLLWLTRLRSLIREKKYELAMTYWQTLPLDEIDSSYKEVFVKDGTEIVIGLLQESFTANDYAKVLKRWGMYQMPFSEYLAKSKDALYYISQSALKLNLTDIAQQYIEKFSTVQEYNFPIWVDRLHSANDFDLLIFKSYLKQKNMTAARSTLASLTKNSLLWNWGQAMMMFEEKKLPEGKNFTESILITEKVSKLDKQDLVDLLLNYFDAQENVDWDEGVRSRVSAILQGISIENLQFKNVIEKGHYLLTECYARDSVKDFDNIEKSWNFFKSNFPESGYIYRMNYIYASSLIKNKKFKQGRSSLDDLIKNAKTPSYIREMAKNDINSLTDSANI